MTLAAFAFAAGAALLQWQAALPSPAWWLILPPLVLLAYWKRKLIPVSTFAFGFLWAALLAHSRMSAWLPAELEGRDLQVVGVVSSLPAVSERGVRFEFDLETMEGAAG